MFQPTIVGYTPIDPDSNRTRRPKSTVYHSSSNIPTVDEVKKTEKDNRAIESNERPRFSTQRSDTTVDPVWNFINDISK